MLVIVFKDRNELVWHTGTKVKLQYEAVDSLVEVQADGHELEFLKENFKNLPYMEGTPCMRWFGDIAKTIADCLPKKY